MLIQSKSGNIHSQNFLPKVGQKSNSTLLFLGPITVRKHVFCSWTNHWLPCCIWDDFMIRIYFESYGNIFQSQGNPKGCILSDGLSSMHLCKSYYSYINRGQCYDTFFLSRRALVISEPIASGESLQGSLDAGLIEGVHANAGRNNFKLISINRFGA